MDYLPLDITVISAEDLKNVNIFSKMDAYVVVSISGDNKNKRKTHVHRNGGTNPRWNHRIKFCLLESSLSQQPYCLLFQLKSDRAFGAKIIGEVAVPICNLLNNGGGIFNNVAEHVVDYQVRTTSGKSKGILKFSYKFGEKFTQHVEATKPKIQKVDEPVMAYPAPACGASTAYPPPPGVGYVMPHPTLGAGYPHAGFGGYPPPIYGTGYPHAAPGYGYAPQPMGYAYAPVQQPQMKKKKMMGGGGKLGMGLGAGLLGGLLVGDMLSDVGDMAAYDAGFDDAGFDF